MLKAVRVRTFAGAAAVAAAAALVSVGFASSPVMRLGSVAGNDTQSVPVHVAVAPAHYVTVQGTTYSPVPSVAAPSLRVAAFPQLPVGTSGNWWTQAHWDRVAQGFIAMGPISTNFGRSPWDETYGSYNSYAALLQSQFNSAKYDKGLSGDIVADGYWGPATTEKLRAVIDANCGQSPKLGVYGAIDGKGANGTIFTFNQDEAEALMKCLNAGKLVA